MIEFRKCMMKYYYYAVEKGNNVYALHFHVGCNLKQYDGRLCQCVTCSRSYGAASLCFTMFMRAVREIVYTYDARQINGYVSPLVYEVKCIQKCLSSTSVHRTCN